MPIRYDMHVSATASCAEERGQDSIERPQRYGCDHGKRVYPHLWHASI